MDFDESRIDALVRRRLATLEQPMQRLTARLEAVVADLSQRLAALQNGQTTYLGDHVALTRLDTGQLIHVDTRGTDIAPHLLTIGTWEPPTAAVFRRLVQPGNVVLDLGSHLGFYTLLAAATTGPTGRVVGFEPNVELCRLANNSIAVNGYGSFTAIHALAVGDAAGEATLFNDPAWSGSSALTRPDAIATKVERITCRVVVLDELFPNEDFVADVVKLDIEGFELRALKGMRHLIERSPALRLLIDVTPTALMAAGDSPQELAEFLVQQGFRFWTINADGALHSLSTAHLSGLTEGSQNIVAVRHEDG